MDFSKLGGFGGMDLSQLTDMARNLSEQAKSMQEEAAKKVYEAKGGGGLVSVKVNGLGEVMDLMLDESLLSDKTSLEILLISTINEALKLSDEGRRNDTLGMLGGMV